MPIIWQDHQKAKRLSQSQPLCVDWATVWTFAVAVISTVAVSAAFWSAVYWIIKRLSHAHS